MGVVETDGAELGAGDGVAGDVEDFVDDDAGIAGAVGFMDVGVVLGRAEATVDDGVEHHVVFAAVHLADDHCTALGGVRSGFGLG